ncbi:cytosine deaminase [Longilinea arvoryzae]|uniref:Cytosine deaminase n=1 Tax=Longilinea arvoryzae TaxID=360412 RepID=A0A0S7BJC8_9CHLR|nr:amidohydrolase family protein [Longilinea arvoryzae]GAP13969.1 cytosine deaminase [Longilinea arvoryzae]
MPSMLILPEWLISVAPQPPLHYWGVRINDGVITHVAPNADLRQNFPNSTVLEAPRQVLSPGFVNAHTHLYGVLAHGLPLGKAPAGFWPFLHDFWWPMVEDRIDHDMLKAATAWQCVQMIKSGVTSFYDCLEGPHSLPGCLNVQAKIVERFGQRAFLSFETTERVSPENAQLGLRENADFIRERKRMGGLVQGLMCFHTTFTCGPEMIASAFDLASELDCLVHMHCSEGTYEPEQAVRNYGKRPIEYYADLGVAGNRMLASQCVQLSPHEVDLIADRGIRVAHMPLSNCEVGGGIAPVPELTARGAIVGLGTDSYIDNFFEVMRSAFLIHKAHRQDPAVMPAGLVWKMATLGGAQALNLNKVGCIQEGWQADLQLIDADFPTPDGEWNLYDQLILYRNPEHIRLVMTAGKTLYQAGQPAGWDESDLRRDLHLQANRLWEKARD